MRQESGMPHNHKNRATDFSDLNISDPLKKGIKELGYQTPTEFQKGVFDHFAHGKNVVGEGQSNYGKSLAFILPILSKVSFENPLTQALIICENFAQSDLATKECRALGRHLNITVENTSAMEKWLPKWPQVLVASFDDVEKLQDIVGLDSIRTVFFDGLSTVHAQKTIANLEPLLTKDVQVLIFGQDTLNAFKSDAQEILGNAAFVNNSDQPKIIKPALHIVHQTKDDEPKPRALLAAMLLHQQKSALVTCNESSEAELLSRFLVRYGFKALFSSEEQNRGAVTDNLAQVASGNVDVFICQNTLLAGQNLSAIPFMINFDMIERPQVYEHTTQFNKQAPGLTRTIVNLVSSRELGYQGPIKAQCLIDFSTQELPSGEEVIARAAERIVAMLNVEAQAIELGQFESLAQKIFDHKNILPALALLLRNHFLTQNTKAERAPDRDRDRERDRPSFERRRPERRDERPARARSSSATPEHDTRPRDDAQPSQPSRESSHEGSTRLYVTLGRQDGFSDLASLAQYLSENAQVDLGHFSGTGMLREHSAHIEVDDDVVDQIIKAIHDSPRQGSSDEGAGEGEMEGKIVCERARQMERKFHRPPQRRNYRDRRH